MSVWIILALVVVYLIGAYCIASLLSVFSKEEEQFLGISLHWREWIYVLGWPAMIL